MNEKSFVIILVTFILVMGGLLGLVISKLYPTEIIGEFEDEIFEADHVTRDSYSLADFKKIYGVAIKDKIDFLEYIKEEGYEDIEQEEDYVFAYRDFGCKYDGFSEFCEWEDIEYDYGEIIITRYKERENE